MHHASPFLSFAFSPPPPPITASRTSTPPLHLRDSFTVLVNVPTWPCVATPGVRPTNTTLLQEPRKYKYFPYTFNLLIGEDELTRRPISLSFLEDNEGHKISLFKNRIAFLSSVISLFIDVLFFTVSFHICFKQIMFHLHLKELKFN